MCVSSVFIYSGKDLLGQCEIISQKKKKNGTRCDSFLFGSSNLSDPVLRVSVVWGVQLPYATVFAFLKHLMDKSGQKILGNWFSALSNVSRLGDSGGS